MGWLWPPTSGPYGTDWTKVALRFVGHAVALWVTASVFLAFNDGFRHNAVEYDEGFFLWCGWCITKGLVPYRDFLEFKPPFVFLTHALALKLFGFKDLGFRRFFMLFPLASILWAQGSLLLRGVSRILATALAVTFVAAFVNPAFHDTALSDSESIGVGYFLLGFGFLMLETKYRTATDVIGGAFMTCSVLSKEPFAPGVAMTTVSVFLLRDGTVDFRTKALRFAKAVGLGVGVVVVGLCIYMVPTGSMRAYLDMASRYTRIYRDPVHSYCVVLGRFHPSTPLHELGEQWDGIRRDFLNPAVLGGMVPLAAAAFIYIVRRSIWLLATTCLGLVGGLWAVTASNCQWGHYYSMTLVAVFAFLAIGLDAMKGPLFSLDGWTRAFILLTVASVAAVAVYPRYDAEAHTVHVTPPAHEPVPGIFDFVEKNSTPADRLLTTGPPFIYVYTNRRSAIREGNVIDEILGVYDGDTDEEKLRPIHDELAAHPPKIVFLDPERADRKRRHLATLIMPFLKELNYRKVSEYIYVLP